jgi:hypothetical protein
LQVGDAITGVVASWSRGFGRGTKGWSHSKSRPVWNKPPVLYIGMSLECFAFIHEEHEHGACAERDAAQVFAFADDADGGDDAVTRHWDQWHHDRLLPLRPLHSPVATLSLRTGV